MKIRYLLMTSVVIGGLIVAVGLKRKPALKVLASKVGQTSHEVSGAKSEVSVTNKVTPSAPSVAATEKAARAQDSVSLPRPEVGEEFRSIQNKVFKSLGESEKIKQIAKDAVYLNELSLYLRNAKSAAKADFRNDQNVAVDILIEALKNGGSPAAEAAIFDIVKDSQIESASLQLPVREALAAVKAEILYQGSAIRSDLFTNVESILPGAVSKKIWENVLLKQNENAQESGAERQSFHVAKTK